MRVVSTMRGRPLAGRSLHAELLGLLVSSAVIGVGLWLTHSARLQIADAGTSGTVLLTQARGPEDLLPLLPQFGSPFERQAAARLLYERAVAPQPPLEHVGGLAQVGVPSEEVRSDPRYGQLRLRLERRPEAKHVPLLTPADIAAIKPRVAVRARDEFSARVRRACALFFAAFWSVHLIRRWRRKADDPIILPLLLMLSGIGTIAMLALRDPIRDTMTVTTFVQGVVAGLVLLLAASEVDVESSRLRRATLMPLGLALGLAALLLVFGSGPGSSGVKVNLFGFQPVELIRLLVIFALAAFFAKRLEFLRELSEPVPHARWLRSIRMPRWKDLRPVVISTSAVLAFFFFQRDLGPALVLSCVFMALYGIARARAPLVLAGFALLAAGFAAAYWIGYPATVRQRVAIWADPWDNGVPGGNQVAHGLWALSTGGFRGSGPGLGSPQSIPAGHTDFVLAAVGEELGFAGLAVVIGLYALLCWRCLRVAARAPGDFTAFLSIGIALGLVVQALVIGSGLVGLLPLAGVVTPFLSSGRSSMLANSIAIGIVLAIASRQGPVRQHLSGPIRTLGTVLAVAAAAFVCRAAWVQVVHADAFATASSLSEQADGGTRFEYNPRLIAAARAIPRGTIYDRNGLPLATSVPEEMATLEEAYRKAGISVVQKCAAGSLRCYPLGRAAFSVLGDWDEQLNWGARNSSYLEREADTHLKGYDDRQRVVDIANRRTGARERSIRRDYGELLPLVRHRFDTKHPAVVRLLHRARDLETSLDGRLQARAAIALRHGIEKNGHARGAVVVLDVQTGELLASVSYPWPENTPVDASHVPTLERDHSSPLLDRARYGLYPPGSTFKLLVAGAALRSHRAAATSTFTCVRLPDGRVGNLVPGWPRPVRDDLLDATPHGHVDLRSGLVASCNAYFAQLALSLGPRPLLDAASAFQIDVARPATAASLRRTLPQAAYGQGQVVVSPLKMARVAAAIAHRGLVMPVRWLAAPDVADEQPQRFLSERDAAVLAGYMREVVTVGTGRTLRSNPTPIAGKTGTAEVDGARAHSWFAGFAPFGGPRKIAFAVLVENAGYGSLAAAPIAGEVVSAARELGLFK